MNPVLIQLRAAFISDIHLGTRECQAALLVEFLARVQVDTLILAGDMVDLCSLRKRMYWPQSHNDVVRAILAKAKSGTRVIYVPGNHDAEFRELEGAVFANLEIHREHIHVTRDGRRLLVIHGDELDGLIHCSAWLAWIGSEVYDLLLWLNRCVNFVRRLLGFPYWSLASYLKHKTGNAMKYVGRFEEAAAHIARRRGLDGIVCGHIHRPALIDHDGLLYCNDGDWVENCTTLVEDMNGRLSLWNWAEHGANLCAVPALEHADRRGFARVETSKSAA